MIDLLDEKGMLRRVAAQVADKKKQKLAQEMFNYPSDPRNKNAIYDTLRTGKPILVKKVTAKWLNFAARYQREREILKELGVKSFIFAPLMSRGKSIGVLTVVSSKPNFSYSEEDLTLAYELADRAGIAVDKARLFSEAQEALRTRDEFLSIASHELKTPLTSILLNLQLILHKIHNATNQKIEMKEIEEMIQISKRQSNRLARLISDLLNISLISTGRLQLEREKVNLSDLIHDVLKRFEVQLKRARMKVEWGKDQKVVGNYDKIRLEQVITNLLSNSIKYGKNKPITLEVKREDNNAVVSIKDRGIGIKKKDLSLIFERFKRGINSKDFKGLGVGLYISRQIIESHDGALTVESKEGKGSTFTLRLPIE